MLYDERDPFSFDHNVALRARFAAIRWAWTGFFAPPGAGILPESMQARDQSIWSAVDRRSRMAKCNFSHTPAVCQSLSLRQQVMPVPQPISGGSISQGIPDLRTNRIPPKTARLLTRGRPPFSLGGSGGNKGSSICHNSSDTRGFAMHLSYQIFGFC
jgi:hypothetical protein